MKIIALLTLGMGSLAHAQPNETPTTVVNPPNNPVRAAQAARPDNPKAQIELDLRSFLISLGGVKAGADAERAGEVHNGERLAPYLSGARLGYFGAQEWAEYFVAARAFHRFQLVALDLEELQPDTARVRVSYHLTSARMPVAPDEPANAPEPPPEPPLVSETLNLKREKVPWLGEEKWRVVAPSHEEFASGQFPVYDLLSLRNVAYFGGLRVGTLDALRGIVSQTRLKNLAMGAAQFVLDYDNEFAFENRFWRDALRPYLHNDALYQIPGTRDFYTFNDHLSDRKLADAIQAARTVLFYEGKDEHPEFHYDGRAAIAFVDGHVEMVTPETAKTLIWKL